jgi:hypothetical protein
MQLQLEPVRKQRLQHPHQSGVAAGGLLGFGQDVEAIVVEPCWSANNSFGPAR